jgi:hypothetical protein
MPPIQPSRSVRETSFVAGPTTGAERIGDPAEARFEPVQIRLIEAVEEVPPNTLEVRRGRLPESVESRVGQHRFLTSGVGCTRAPLDRACGFEPIHQPGHTAPRQDDPLGEDVHPDAPSGRVGNLEEGVVLGQGQAVGRLELLIETPGDPCMRRQEAPPRADPR